MKRNRDGEYYEDTSSKRARTDEEEVDPLDEFMEGIEDTLRKEERMDRAPNKEEVLEAEDHSMDLLGKIQEKARVMRHSRVSVEGSDSDEEVYATAKAMEKEEMGEEMMMKRKMDVESLAPLKHSDIYYHSFCKDFYRPHEEIEKMLQSEVANIRRELGVKVQVLDRDSKSVPPPCTKFAQFNLDKRIEQIILGKKFERPTPIQAQAVPVALKGRDIIGIAKTGSGKTAAFVWPMIGHVMDQPPWNNDENGVSPVGLIVAPTRELTQQIYEEAKEYCSPFGLKVVPIYGGLTKYEQLKKLKKGADVIVATPGRFIDMIKKKGCNLLACTYLVIDEADKMFDLGFEPQIRSIVGQIRPDRQTLMFSATFGRRVESLAKDELDNPVKITIGIAGEANEDVLQRISIVENEKEKLHWLVQHLEDYVLRGSCLVFSNTKDGCDDLCSKLNRAGYHAASIHGDHDQEERDNAIMGLRSGAVQILVGTDVAARGLNIPNIKTVINYDIAKDVRAHVHRIGRCGRAGDREGIAHSIIMKNQKAFAKELLRSLERTRQRIPQELTDFVQGVHSRKGRSSNRSAIGMSGAMQQRSSGYTQKRIQNSKGSKVSSVSLVDSFRQSFVPSTTKRQQAEKFQVRFLPKK